MIEKINLKELEQKTFREFMIDGITEILAGLIFLFIPVLLVNPIFVVFTPFLLFTSPKILDYIRQRTTYPRIGRVEFKVDETTDPKAVRKALFEFLFFLLIVLIITVICMIIFEGSIPDISSWYSWVPLIFGLIMFGPSLYLVDQTGLKYYYLLGIFPSLLGLLLSVIAFPSIKDGMYIFFFILGILALILGIFRYIWFIRNYPIVNLEES